MTVIYNIWVGLSSWAQSTNYTAGTYVSNSGNAYLCIQSGKSASTGSGPTLTTSSIIDNSVIWQYISGINYSGATGDVALGNAYAALPSTFTQNVVWDIWNTGIPIQTSAAGTSFINDSGLTIAPYYWIIQAAPGNSIRDKLLTNSCPFSFGNGANGVSFLLPNSIGSPVNYFSFNSNNIIVSGLMFKDPIINSGSTIINFQNPNCTLQYCIIEGTGQPSGATIIGYLTCTNMIIANCLVLDHAPNSNLGNEATLRLGSNSFIYNSVFVSVLNSGAFDFCVDASSGTNVAVKNCMFFGYANNAFESAAVTATNCLFDNPIFPNFIGTNGGGCLVNQPITSQFMNSNNDFRLISTSAAINAGLNLSSIITASDDIAYTHRPQKINWDIGPWEYKSSGSSSKAMVFKTLIG